MGYYYTITPATVKQEGQYFVLEELGWEAFHGKRPHEFFWEHEPEPGFYVECGEDDPKLHNMPVRTLMLVDPSEDTWEMLGENAGFFGDNGGDPDGPSWLPSDILNEGDEGVEEALALGEGKMALVRYYEGYDEINQAFVRRGYASPNALAEVNGKDEMEDEEIEEALNQLPVSWAYYTGSETLVIQADW